MIPKYVLPTVVTALSLGMAVPALSGEGHDHGDTPAVVNSNGPQRLPDGGVFLPKPAQRQLGVRTLLAQTAGLPRSVELNGKVVMDPNAGGKVQPLNAGRIEPGPQGLPSPGQTVRKGEVLAYVMPSIAPIERSNQAAQLAELQAARRLADQRLTRLQELADTVPRKDLEAAESEVHSLAARIAAVGGGLSTREPLVAPVSCVVASTSAVAGQVVDARELLAVEGAPGGDAPEEAPEGLEQLRPLELVLAHWVSPLVACRAVVVTRPHPVPRPPRGRPRAAPGCSCRRTSCAPTRGWRPRAARW